jgi:hypothetical protein
MSNAAMAASGRRRRVEQLLVRGLDARRGRGYDQAMSEARNTVTAADVHGLLRGYKTPEEEAEERLAAAEAKIASALTALKTPGATNWERVQAAGLVLNG